MPPNPASTRPGGRCASALLVSGQKNLASGVSGSHRPAAHALVGRSIEIELWFTIRLMLQQMVPYP